MAVPDRSTASWMGYVRVDIDLPRFRCNDITPGETFIERASLRDSIDRAETAGSRWRHDDVSHHLLLIIAASTTRLNAMTMHTLLSNTITTNLYLAA